MRVTDAGLSTVPREDRAEPPHRRDRDRQVRPALDHVPARSGSARADERDPLLHCQAHDATALRQPVVVRVGWDDGVVVGHGGEREDLTDQFLNPRVVVGTY
jgi:hypothetical protein